MLRKLVGLLLILGVLIIAFMTLEKCSSKGSAKKVLAQKPSSLYGQQYSLKPN